MADKPEIQPNKGVFAVVFVVGLIVFAFLFNLYGFLKLPSGTAQEIAAYYGTRMIPIGIALTLLGVAAAIAASIGTAFGKVVGGSSRRRGRQSALGTSLTCSRRPPPCLPRQPASGSW
jgi:hypothetical protein